MTQRPTFTPDQLKIGGNHLLYEVQMLCNTAALLEEDRWEAGWKDKTDYMAVLESFLMHARSVMYFLCPPRGYKRNALKQRELYAVDFCRPGWTAKVWNDFGTERDNISKDLMHLSIDRLEVGRSWEYARLLRDLGNPLGDFLDQADRLSDHLRSEIRAALDGKRVATADTSNTAAYSFSFAGLPGSSVPTTAAVVPESLPVSATGPFGPR